MVHIRLLIFYNVLMIELFQKVGLLLNLAGVLENLHHELLLVLILNQVDFPKGSATNEAEFIVGSYLRYFEGTFVKESL